MESQLGPESRRSCALFAVVKEAVSGGCLVSDSPPHATHSFPCSLPSITGFQNFLKDTLTIYHAATRDSQDSWSDAGDAATHSFPSELYIFVVLTALTTLMVLATLAARAALAALAATLAAERRSGCGPHHQGAVQAAVRRNGLMGGSDEGC